MAEITFHYFPSNSIIHKIDPRFKLVFIIILCTSILYSHSTGLIIQSIIIVLSLMLSTVPLSSIYRELKYFLIIILLMIIAKGITTPGEKILYLPFTIEGLIAGLFFSWKFILVILCSVLFTASTSMFKLKSAVVWFLRPVPLIPESRIAVMMSLTITFIPLIFDQIKEMMDAQTARCIGLVKNPVRRIKLMALPLFLRTFEKADEIVMAMESRCYTEERTEFSLKASVYDWVFLAVLSILCTVSILQ